MEENKLNNQKLEKAEIEKVSGGADDWYTVNMCVCPFCHSEDVKRANKVEYLDYIWTKCTCNKCLKVFLAGGFSKQEYQEALEQGIEL